MEMNDYLPRVIDARLDEYLQAFGAVCVEGPKWCGKTWTSLHHSKSAILSAIPLAIFRIVSWQSFRPIWCWKAMHLG